MSTTDTVLLFITAIGITLFYVLASVLTVLCIMLVNKVKAVVAKAEVAIGSVEEAAETIKNAGESSKGPFAAFKIIKSIIDIVSKDKKK